MTLVVLWHNMYDIVDVGITRAVCLLLFAAYYCLEHFLQLIDRFHCNFKCDVRMLRLLPYILLSIFSLIM
jgi:hypothetical protein